MVSVVNVVKGGPLIGTRCCVYFRSSKLNTLVTKLHEFLGHSPEDESIDFQDISNGEDPYRQASRRLNTCIDPSEK